MIPEESRASSPENTIAEAPGFVAGNSNVRARALGSCAAGQGAWITATDSGSRSELNRPGIFAQSGYLLLGIIALNGSSFAMPAILVFAAAYAAMNLGAFAVVAGFGNTLNAVRGLGRARPLAGAAMVVFLLSLVGIPPLAGFVGKFLLFGAAIDAGLSWLAVAAILNSVLSLAVYLPHHRADVPAAG